MGIPKGWYTLNTDENIDDTSDLHTIELVYTSVLGQRSDYLPQRVLIEISARALTEPAEMRPITSMVDDAFPDQPFNTPPFEVNVVLP